MSAESNENLIEKVLAERKRGKPVFRFARRVKAKGVAPYGWKAAVELLCQKTGQDPEEGWSEFLTAYDEVAIPSDAFAWAAEQARLAPLHHEEAEKAGPNYVLLYSVATYLGSLTHPYPFALPTDKVRALLGCSQQTVSNMVRWLQNRGVMEWVGNEVVYGKGDENRCKLYALKGEPRVLDTDRAAYWWVKDGREYFYSDQ